MNRRLLHLSLFGLVALLALPMSSSLAGEPAPAEAPAEGAQVINITDLSFQVPAGWQQTPPKSAMRLAQVAVPGDAGAGELTIFRFPGGAGGVEANIERWRGQFAADAGAPEAQTRVEEVGVLRVTLVELRGTFVAPVSPRSQQRRNEKDWAMFGAIIEGHGDAYYFKLVGPRATLEAGAPAWKAMIQSLTPRG